MQHIKIVFIAEVAIFFKIEEGSEYLNEIALCIGNF